MWGTIGQRRPFVTRMADCAFIRREGKGACLFTITGAARAARRLNSCVASRTASATWSVRRATPSRWNGFSRVSQPADAAAGGTAGFAEGCKCGRSAARLCCRRPVPGFRRRAQPIGFNVAGSMLRDRRSRWSCISWKRHHCSGSRGRCGPLPASLPGDWRVRDPAYTRPRALSQ